MSDTRDLTVRIKGDSKNFEKSIGNVSKQSHNAGLSFAKLTGAVAAGQAVFALAEKGLNEVVGAVKESVKAYQESQDVQAQLQAVLKSTHGAAGLYIEDLNDQAKALQKLTKFSDEQINSSQGLLLTFTQIKGAVFQEAIPAIMDMATAMKTDLQTATIQVGKALNDPLKGITALKRVGVTFTAEQKKQIENFVKTNQLAKAQGVVLKELNKEFGGSAQAAGNTFSGSLAKLKNSLNDVQEKVGEVIVTRLSPFISKAMEAVASIDWAKVIDNTLAAMNSFNKTLVQTYQTVFNYLAPGVKRFVFVLQEVWHWVYNMIAPSFKALANTVATQLLPQIIRIWNAIEPGFTTALKVLGVMLAGLVVGGMWAFINVSNIVFKVIGFVTQALTNLIKWIGNYVGVLVNTVKTLVNLWIKLPGYIKAALKDVTEIIKAPFKAAFDWIGKQLDRLKSAFDKLKGAAGAIGRSPSNAFNAIKGVFDNMFASGGYTGSGNPNEPAGIVHKGEYVVPANQVDQSTGMPKIGGGGIVINVNMGMYAGMPIEKRQIAIDLYKELVRTARSNGVQMPIIPAVGVQ